MQMVALPLLIIGAPIYLVMQPSRRSQILSRMGWRLQGPTHRKNKTVWIHALSVGEVTSAIPLVEELVRTRGESTTIIMSASTRSGRELADRLLGPVCDAVIYFPFDVAPVVKFYLRKLTPDLFILIETDFWPNFVRHASNAGVPLILFNGRISAASMAKYRRFGFISKPLFDSFQLLCMQTDGDAKKMRSLGISENKIQTIGNLKFADPAKALPEEPAGNLPLPTDKLLLFGGSTHEGEETILAETFARLRNRSPDLHLVIAPRDIRRCGELVLMFESMGLTVRRYSSDAFESTDITLIDTIGDLAKLYRFAAISFIGGSLNSFVEG